MNAIRQALACLALIAITAFTATAQERLIDQEPHDLLTIPSGKEIATLNVYPLKFRRMPKDPKPTDKIPDVKLVEDEDNRTFEVMWRDVKKIEFFEDRVLAEAETLAAAGKLDDAYANYA